MNFKLKSPHRSRRKKRAMRFDRWRIHKGDRIYYDKSNREVEK